MHSKQFLIRRDVNRALGFGNGNLGFYLVPHTSNAPSFLKARNCSASPEPPAV